MRAGASSREWHAADVRGIGCGGIPPPEHGYETAGNRGGQARRGGVGRKHKPWGFHEVWGAFRSGGDERSMSGIVGLVRPDGGPADEALVRALTRFLAFRGPDGRNVWHGGSVALGHAMLRTAEGVPPETQPVGFDGKLWITADARLDARGELIDALGQRGRNPARNAPDCELILHAYAAWGEECLDRLRGDFAFGIWDAERKSLFCARDHFGIKPFYFTEQKDFFLFSNTLDCVRMHPDVPDELNEMAVADFLLFGLNCDPAATTFRAIRRLPPAHFLRVSADGLRIGRYWSVPVDGRIRYKHSDEYVEHFQVLLRDAVADRLCGNRVGIMMSGGLDSSSLAATAREISPERGEAGKLRAYTVTYAPLVHDSDAPYAHVVAEFLGIPLRSIELQGVRPYENWDDSRLRTPEPVDDPLLAGLFLEFQVAGADCRAVLNGEGPDNLMHFQMGPYVRHLLRQREWGRLSSDLPRYVQLRRPLWRGAARLAQRKLRPDGPQPKFPSWIDREFARRVQAKSRWREGPRAQVSPAHPMAPKAHSSMSLPEWARYFEVQNAGVTRRLVEVRFPYLDLRIVNYLLAVPPFPWFFHKRLLREAMFGRLPESVRLRPKTVPQSDPLATTVARGMEDQKKISWNSETATFVDSSKFSLPRFEENPWGLGAAMRPLTLNHWLQHSRPIQYKLAAEVRHASSS